MIMKLGRILSISQFTLYADTKKGNRPSYVNAMGGENAIKLYDEFNKRLRTQIKVEEGKQNGIYRIDLYTRVL